MIDITIGAPVNPIQLIGARKIRADLIDRLFRELQMISGRGVTRSSSILCKSK
jgi:hypothetical protein